jgi:hypothetical protein
MYLTWIAIVASLLMGRCTSRCSTQWARSCGITTFAYDILATFAGVKEKPMDAAAATA